MRPVDKILEIRLSRCKVKERLRGGDIAGDADG